MNRTFFRALTIATLALTATPALAQDRAAAPALDPNVAAEMVAAANAVIAATQGPGGPGAAVSPASALAYALDAPERQDWSYWPREREGLSLGRMNANQRMLTHDLLETLLSARGYLEVSAIMSLEQVLAAIETVGFPRGEEYYWLTFYDEPSLEEPWGWSFEGHHVSLNVTMAGDELSVTPSFFGSNPMRVQTGARAGQEMLRYERIAAFRLLESLDEQQRDAAIISDEAPRDILSGQLGVQDWSAWREAVNREGLLSSDMTDEQKRLLEALLDEVIARYRSEIAEAERAAIDVDDLSFAWMGPTEEGTPYYFRIVGESFVYEFDAAQDNGNHAHSVWRDKEDDFGAASLERHYQEHPHP
jgi:hypothetical protein